MVQLNYSAVSCEGPFDRDTVETCVREVVQAVSRSVAAGKSIHFTFSGIGRLQIKDRKVKMKFYKSFLNTMDGSGRLIDMLSNVSLRRVFHSRFQCEFHQFVILLDYGRREW